MLESQQSLCYPPTRRGSLNICAAAGYFVSWAVEGALNEAADVVLTWPYGNETERLRMAIEINTASFHDPNSTVLDSGQML
jgi:hypothetical protein